MLIWLPKLAITPILFRASCEIHSKLTLMSSKDGALIMLRTKTRNILTGCRKSVLGGAHISAVCHEKAVGRTQPKPRHLPATGWGSKGHQLSTALRTGTFKLGLGCSPASLASRRCCLCFPPFCSCWGHATRLSPGWVRRCFVLFARCLNLLGRGAL